MYKSPIDVIQGEMQMQVEGEIFRAVQNVGVYVDKEELLKALAYDRNQYEKGYADAEEKHRWIPCSERLPSMEEVEEWAVFLATIRVREKYDIMDFCLFGTDGKWLVSEGREVIAWKRQMPYQPKEDKQK